MMEKKSYWRRSAAWVTALKDKPLRNARARLTGLYVLQTLVVLIVFVTVLGLVRSHYFTKDLRGNFASPAIEETIINQLWSDLQASTIILILFVLIAIGILSYIAVELTLRPIRIFLEGHRRFIADASHELRTPLAVMRTEIEVALMDPENLSNKEAVEILASNAEEIERMSKILTNLLNLASFNDVSGTPPMVPVDLAAIVEETMKKTEKAAELKQIKLVARQIDRIKVLGNSTALEEVAINLIKNAINYSHPGSTVAVTARELNENYAELIIRDNGIGIAPEELSHIFEPFYRSERSLHMYKSGTGLGLPLVKEMIKRHKGSIHIESAPDKGTTITVHLPLAAHRSVAEEEDAS
jgi:two-component system sensor histidine kinase CiaH